MLELNGPAFMRAIMQIQIVETVLQNRQDEEEWKSEIDAETAPIVTEHLDSLESAMNVLYATLSLMTVQRARAALEKGMTWETLGRHLGEIKSRLADELSLVRVFVLDPRSTNYLLAGEDLLGPAINNNFPAAVFDLEEAAKCLAVLRPTASAFHSMRALEVAIKAVARFLGIPDPTKPSERNWGVVLATIKAGIDKNYPTSTDKGPHTEGSRVESIYASLDAVRNPWQNATMHNENVYQPAEADHILKCVNMLFLKLAEICDEKGSPV